MRFRRPQKFSVLLVSLPAFLLLSGCRGESKSGVQDSTAALSPVAASKSPAPVNTGWDEESAGKFMILSSAEDGVSAALVLPNETDSTLSQRTSFQLESLANAAVDLFNPAGSTGSSTIAVNSQQQPSEGCLVWPSVRLMTKPASQWTVGFASGRVKAIQIDSVEKLSSSDSVAITTELAKQASALSVNGNPAFQGLPFIVQKAYRLSMGDSTVIVGNIVRKINEEANPREEHLLLIIERPSPNSPYSVGYQNTTSGPEDAVRTSSLLAAVRFVSNNRPALVISFEYDDGGQVALLQRVSSANWKITWRSAYTGC